MLKIIIGLLFSISASVSCANSNNDVVENIKRYSNEQQKNQIQFLKKLVNINSATSNIVGVKQAEQLVRKELSKLGFKSYLVEEPKEMHRAPTLMAKRNGDQGKKILLIAHLDTVYESKNKINFISDAHTAKGAGTSDDKGGVVVLLYALKALQHLNALKNTNITIVIMGDEEESGKPTAISRKPLIEVAKQSDVAIDFEPSIMLGTASISRRGISRWVVTASGIESHSATIFQQAIGYGAIFELARIIDTMRSALANEKYLTFNPGIVLAGTNVNYKHEDAKGMAFGRDNVVANIATVSGDLRFLSQDQRQQAEERITNIVKQSLPGTKANVRFYDGIPAMEETKNNAQLLEEYSLASVSLGYGMVKSFNQGQRGAGDISHVASIVPANVAGLGPVGYGTHSKHERVELASFPIQTARAALLIYRLTR